MRYYLIAGEASGDLHASNLMVEISELDPSAEFRYWGGDLMKAQGGVLVKHIRELAFMGFIEVLANLHKILRNFRICKKDLLAFNPDALILVDYPGFNLRMAAFAKRHNITTIYYISPQIWAWKQSRVKKIKRNVDKMLVILPFEKEFYSRFNVDVDFTGHPLLDAIEKEKYTEKGSFTNDTLPEKPLIAILPGSRKQEVSRMLDVMVRVAADHQAYHFVVAGLSSLPADMYEKYSSLSNLSIVYDKAYELLAKASAAIVTSGTATLETALFEVPQVVCYRASKLTYFIARKLVKVKYISLVNLIMDKPVVKELIQGDFNHVSLASELSRIMSDDLYRDHITEDYKLLRERLGGTGASRRAARKVIELISQGKKAGRK